jgi:ubiquinone/menaquinone biosynthesis C-methylase UbiE
MELNNLQGNAARLPYWKRLILHILRIFFQLLYHQFATTYDLIASIVSAGSWQKWVLSVEPYLHGPRILEIGFGPGHLLKALGKKDLIVFGIDESYQMVRLARKRLLRDGISAKLIRGDAQNLPFKCSSFDQVVMTFPDEYILQSSTLSEIQRALVNGGEAVILPLAWVTGRKPWERLVAWVNRVTGEAPQWDARIWVPLDQSGFKSSWEMINYTDSRIVLVHLRKT